jgi:hypothetical protein
LVVAALAEQQFLQKVLMVATLFFQQLRQMVEVELDLLLLLLD